MKSKSLVLGLVVLMSLSSVLVALAGGKLLGSNVKVTDAGLNELVDATHPDVAANGNTIYAVWEDYRDVWDEAEIYLAKSTDGGATWGANVSVSEGYENEIGLESPAVAVYPDDWVYVVWFNPYPTPGGECGGYETCVYMASSSDGADFGQWALWGSGDDWYDIAPQIAIDPAGGDIAVAVSDYVGTGTGEEDVYGLIWDYDAQTWRAGVANDVTGSATSSVGAFSGARMAVASENDVTYLAWEDARDGAMRIYGDWTTDHGQNWGTDFAISPAGVEASRPRLALAPDGSLYAAYEADGHVHVRRSTDQGQSWSTPVQVTSVPEGNELGRWDLAVDGNGSVAVVWAEGYWGSLGSSQLLLSTSIDGGQSFTYLRVDDGGDIYSQYSPAIAAYGSGDDARAVMVWGDDRNVHEEIWSACAEVDATPPTAPSNPQATPGDTVVDLSWGPSSDANGIEGYYVIRAPSSGGPYSVLNPLPLTTTSYRDVGLDGSTYYYKVFAVDGTGNVGPASNEVSAAATVGSDLPLNGTLAYESGADVRLNDLPGLGSDRALAQGSRPLFAGDGQRVYYYDNHAILSRALDGSGLQTYYSHADLMGGFDIARDDDGYFTWIEEEAYSQINPYATWTVFEPHYGTGAATEYVDTYEFADSPTLSSGQAWLAYTSLGHHAPHQGVYEYERVALCLADLGSDTRLATHVAADYQDPAFAPNGSTLAFAADFSGQYEIWKATVAADGSLAGVTQLTRSAGGQWSLAPAWSSDGNWLVFARGAPAPGTDLQDPELTNPQLYVVRADGSSLRALNVSGAEPAWHGGGAAGASHRVYLPLVVR